MLMADFVAQSSSGTGTISKGVRAVSISRDFFVDETDGDSINFEQEVAAQNGFNMHLSGNADSDTSFQFRLPAFGTNWVHRGYQSDTRVKLYIDTTDKDSSATKDNTASYNHEGLTWTYYLEQNGIKLESLVSEKQRNKDYSFTFYPLGDGVETLSIDQ